MALPDGIPPLELNSTQEEYNKWYEIALARTKEYGGETADPNFFFVDLNDGVMNYVCLRVLVRDHPELEERASEICNEAVRAGMEELGMFMGAQNIAEKLGVSQEEAEAAMLSVWKKED